MDESTKQDRYFIVTGNDAKGSRSDAAVIALRRCYVCRQADPNIGMTDSDPLLYVDQIVSHCANTPDYLLPNTPLKEAIFRDLLAGGNEPQTPDDISQRLSERWAVAPYPRDISSPVIRKLLEGTAAYGISKVSKT